MYDSSRKMPKLSSTMEVDLRYLELSARVALFATHTEAAWCGWRFRPRQLAIHSEAIVHKTSQEDVQGLRYRRVAACALMPSLSSAISQAVR